MTIRHSWETQNKTYSVDSHIEYVEHQIASILYISGLDGKLIESYEIEEMLSAVRDTFKVTKESILVGDIKSDIKPSHEFFMTKNSSKLTLVLRRNMRWLKIAKYVKGMENV